MRLFVTIHVIAVGAIYLLAVLLGGGLGGMPWPPEGPVAMSLRPVVRHAMPEVAGAVEPRQQASADYPPQWLAQRSHELPLRQVPDLSVRAADPGR